MFRVFLAQERTADQIPIVTGLLERWRNAVPGFTADMRQAAGEVVERLVVATRLRYPVVGDLARSIRYEAFERPLIEAARDDVYADVREQLKQLAAGAGPGGVRRTDRGAGRQPGAADPGARRAADLERPRPAARCSRR